MQKVIKGSTLNLCATVDPGNGNTVREYHWYLDGVDLQHGSYELSINTTPLEPVSHVVLFQATNSCGKSGNAELQFELVEVTKMEKIVNIDVNQPMVSTTIVAEDTATLEVTVNTQFAAPKSGVTVIVDGVTQTTGADGKTTFSNVVQELQKQVRVQW